VNAFHVTFWVATGVAVLALLASLLLPGREPDEPTIEEAEVAEAAV
jgi:hypothetical protein